MPPPTGPAEPGRGRLLARVSVTLGGSFAGQTWKIKFDIGQSKAREGDLPDGHPAQLDPGHAGFSPEPAFGYAEYREVAPASRPALPQETCGNSGSPRQRRTSAKENKTMINFWDSLTADQKRAFRAKAHERVFAAGAQLMQEGEHGDHAAVILSGLTEIRVCEDGAEHVLAVRGPGQLIGERAALEVNPRSATVVALQTVVALVIRTADFAAFISTYPAVLKIVEDQIFTRLREAGRPALRSHRPGAGGGGPQGWRSPRCFRAAATAGTDRPELHGRAHGRRGVRCGRTWRRGPQDHQAGAPGHDPASPRTGLGHLPVRGPRRRPAGHRVTGIPTAQVIERLVSMLPPKLKRHNRIYSAAAGYSCGSRSRSGRSRTPSSA